MIERKIREGMILNFPLPTFQAYQDSGSFLQPVPMIYCHVWRRGSTEKRTRGVGNGALNDTMLRRQAHRNFAWLPFRPGYTTYTTLGDCDVLSGEFSGCRMLLCDVNGVRTVFHIGTYYRDDSEESVRAKRAMHALLSGAGVNYITGFSPAGNYNPLPGDFGAGRPWVLGLITENADCYSILMKSEFFDTAEKTVFAVEAGVPITRGDALAFFDV